MLDIAICEDERYQQGQLEKLLDALGKKMHLNLEIHVYERGESLLEEIQKGTQYDIVYLDIEMKGMSGLEVAEELRKTDHNIQIIYVTQFEQYIWNSIETMPSGYVMKPIKPDKFEQNFSKIAKWIMEKDEFYRFISKKKSCKVLLKDILYFRSRLRQVDIVCGTEQYETYMKLDTIEQELKEKYNVQFLRIHQSYLVNYHYIERFSCDDVMLNNGQHLPISRQRRREIEKLLGGSRNADKYDN